MGLPGGVARRPVPGIPDPRRGGSHRSLLTASLLVAFACGGESDRPPTAEVVDSAGVRIVAYDLTDQAAPVYRTVGEPDLMIGERDGAPETTFSRIADLALADDGSIVVSDGVAQELRVFDASGAYLRTLGGSGDGPGEFAAEPLIVGTSHDTLFVFDNRSDRVTTFTTGGELLDMLTLRSEDVGRPASVARLDDGTYLSQSVWRRPSSGAVFYDARLELDSIVIERLQEDGSLLDTIRVMADRTMARTVQDRGEGRIGLLQAPSPFTGRAVVLAHGVRPMLAHSASFELELLGARGFAETVLRVAGVQHPATADEIRSYQEGALREDFGDAEIPPLVRQLNIEYLPERLAAFGAVVISDGGDLWVSLSEFDLSEGLEWLVFSRDGVLRGTVHTPPEFRLREVRNDFILGFVLDELDVPYVRRYPLASPRAGQAPAE